MKYGLKESLIEELIGYAQKYDIEKLMIFGSRARGDYSERSDIDLAFWGGDATNFILDVNEDTNTLLLFDIVDMSRPVQEELKTSILSEGVVLYEKV